MNKGWGDGEKPILLIQINEYCYRLTHLVNIIC